MKIKARAKSVNTNSNSNSAADDQPFTTDPAPDVKSSAGAGDKETPDGHSSDFEFAMSVAANCSPTKFYTRSEDKKGHSFDLRAHAPKWWGGPLGYIVEAVPAYKTLSDFVKDAVYQRVCWLLLNVDGLDPAELAPYVMSCQAEQVKQALAAVASMQEATAKVCDALFEVRDYEGMAAFLDAQEQVSKGLTGVHKRKTQALLAKCKKKLALGIAGSVTEHEV